MCINICSAKYKRTLNTIHSTRNYYSNGLYINLNRCPYKRQVCSYKADFRRSKNDKGKRNGDQKTKKDRRQKGRTRCGIRYVMCRIVHLRNDFSENIHSVSLRIRQSKKGGCLNETLGDRTSHSCR